MAKNSIKGEEVCSFCGQESPGETVKKDKGVICKECVRESLKVFESYRASVDSILPEIHTPSEIKTHLDTHVIGQD